MPAKPTAIYQLKITLRGSKSPIWRQIQVHSNTTLPQLHQIIQLAMGWHNILFALKANATVRQKMLAGFGVMVNFWKRSKIKITPPMQNCWSGWMAPSIQKSSA